MVTIGVTPKCNNNCIMCVYDTCKLFNLEENTKQENLKQVEDLENGEVIALSGGEPLLSKNILELLEKSLKTGHETLLLTNGRSFYYDSLVKKIASINKGNFKVAVSLCGSNSKVHDETTRAKGSFLQTKQGIKNLLKNKIRVEIRITLTKINLNDLENISEYIIREFKGVEETVFIFPLIRGNAKKNIFVIPKYDEIDPELENAMDKLIENNIKFKLYHFPFCRINPFYWDYVYNSLKDAETKKPRGCNVCHYCKYCGGVPQEYLELFGESEFKPLDDKIEVNMTQNKYNPLRAKNKAGFQFIKSYFGAKYGRFNSSLPDIVAVKYNLKPLARLSCNTSFEFEFIQHILEKEGIFCECSDKKILSGKNPELNYNDPQNGLIDMNSNKLGTLYVYISKSKKLAQQIKNNDPEISCKPSDETIKKFSEALGYPNCCIQNAIKTLNTDKKQFLKKIIFGKTHSFYLNSFFRGISNNYLSFHTPCSLDCEKTLEYNQKIFSAIQKEYVSFAKQISDILRYPSLIWFDIEGKLMDMIDNRFGVVFKGILKDNEIKYSAIHIFNMGGNIRHETNIENEILLKFKKGNRVKIYEGKIEVYLDNLLIETIIKKHDLEGVPMVFN